MENSCSLRLPRDQPLALEAGRHATIEVEAGTVWLTFPGSADIFVRAGQRHRLPASGKAVIEAVFGDATVSLHPERRRHSRPPRRLAGASGTGWSAAAGA